MTPSTPIEPDDTSAAQSDAQLDTQLAQLTTWPGPSPRPTPWALAWQAAAAGRAAPTRFRYRLPTVITTAVAAIVIFAVTISVLLPSLGRARQSSRSLNTNSAAVLGRGYEYDVAGGLTMGLSAPSRVAAHEDLAARVTMLTTKDSWNQVAEQNKPAAAGVSSPPPAPPPDTRAVIRRATVELTAPDVRAAFLKAQLLASEAQGEYIQDSSLTGSGKAAQANLTLRIAASRLSAVLNALRDLGTVKSEAVTGEDVTAQVVDIDARLRNERRVETELLQLLESRKDAPLKEILDLRASLSDVRRTIEQLTAQQDKLSHLISLSTILLIIRADDAALESQTTPTGIWTYFTAASARAWRSGLTVLADTIAVLVSIAIGGILWWIALSVLTLLIWRTRRRWRHATGG